MAPNRRKLAKASDPRDTAKTFAEYEELLKARALKRAQRAEARRGEAEGHKETGNAHFRKGEYCKVIEEYKAAITINGPSPAYLSNMAAAWLKLEEYDSAEHCAQRALCLDPRFAKARYRRGLARKGNLQLAAAVVGALTRGASYLDDRATETAFWFIDADFAAVLVQDPDSTEASKALDETFTLISERNKEEAVVEEDSHPTFIDQGKELESVSDSSDWNHEGNGFPCRYYNHDGCTRGVECKFSHAPDHKSVRDRLGRNVCVQFLFGECRFGSCVYSHDKTYLPSGRWWDDEEKLADVWFISQGPVARQNPAFLPCVFAIVDDRIAWAPAHAAEMEEVSAHWRENMMMLKYVGNAMDDGLEYAAHRSKGRRSRGGQGRGRGRGCGRAENWGFTDDEVQELLCQGVKPWDDDAHDVLDALYSL
ncbi:hypothetical protein EDB92DRAFT_1955086 [Lactarius akahatsu]|uniref:C3H1-type domain-containing protein n=1 Tax=Lactarius akahatsu TaxID=416441 RepID=A0AAD4Q7W8_9AGAM|nr:hypothetical protein EDB92DRAFT_1955086 [Lactarius akahatsu]